MGEYIIVVSYTIYKYIFEIGKDCWRFQIYLTTNIYFIQIQCEKCVRDDSWNLSNGCNSLKPIEITFCFKEFFLSIELTQIYLIYIQEMTLCKDVIVGVFTNSSVIYANRCNVNKHVSLYRQDKLNGYQRHPFSLV